MLSKGAQRIVLYLYTRQSDDDYYSKRFLGAGKPPFSVPLKRLRITPEIYKGKTKIYPALAELKRYELIVVFSDPNLVRNAQMSDYEKFMIGTDLMELEGADVKALRDIKSRQMFQEAEKKTLGPRGLIKQAIDRGERYYKGLLKRPSQKFVYLTPDGMFLGRVLKRG